jgi:Na+-transporting NADH:ubiquinone oxidoreductase subunit C
MHGVDAISGATITSKGVTEMFERTLNNYIPYFKKQEAIVFTN